MKKSKNLGGRPRITRSPLATFPLMLEEGMVKEIDALVTKASKADGRTVSRSELVRTLLRMGLDAAAAIRADVSRKSRAKRS